MPVSATVANNGRRRLFSRSKEFFYVWGRTPPQLASSVHAVGDDLARMLNASMSATSIT